MEMLHNLNALAGKISPQSGTDNNANKLSLSSGHHHNNNNTHPHPYSKRPPPTYEEKHTNGTRGSPDM